MVTVHGGLRGVEDLALVGAGHQFTHTRREYSCFADANFPVVLGSCG